MTKILSLILFSCLLLLSSSLKKSTIKLEKYDVRAFQHGIDFIKHPDGHYILIWASSGNPPVGEDDEGEWSHNVYYSMIQPIAPKINPIPLISVSGAQEPVSAALSQDGHIMITMEDSYQAKHNLMQSYAVYDLNMNAVKAYQNIVFDGGHSGHVAAIGHHFAVFYSDEWVDGGGVDDLGSGDDVLLKLYDSNGRFLSKKKVAVGDKTRDWWPMIAGSDKTALLVWQRFVDDETHSHLIYRVLDVKKNKWVSAEIKLMKHLKYYTYDVQYLAEIKRFIITGTDNNDEGFVFLVSKKGKIIAQQKSLPAFVREAQPAISMIMNKQLTIVYPTAPTGVIVLEVSEKTISVKNKITLDYPWSYSGTDGVFLDQSQVYFVSLSVKGLQEFRINIDR
ncbi:MAG: hypothetical protein KAU26_06115 [Methylococcales bacterium]|nr:hypothetical protein [Methylococcales bacterium]